jgi:hypothetical protein
LKPLVKLEINQLQQVLGGVSLEITTYDSTTQTGAPCKISEILIPKADVRDKDLIINENPKLNSIKHECSETWRKYIREKAKLSDHQDCPAPTFDDEKNVWKVQIRLW